MAQLLFLRRPDLKDPHRAGGSGRDLIAAPISAFESDTAAVIQKAAPKNSRLILQVLAAMVALALGLMAVVKLDRVVTAPGRILPTAGSLFVQPLDRAIVSSILVRPGDVVRKGEVLARLDPTFAQADLTDLTQKQASGAALVARLKAEQAGLPYSAEPGSPYSVLQATIWAERRNEYTQSMNDFDQRAASDRSAVDKARGDAADYGQRLELASQAEQAQIQLEKSGYGRKLSLLSATDTRVEMQRMTAEAQNAASGGAHDLAALAAQRAVYIGKWRDDIATQLVAAQNDLDAANQALSKAAKMSDLSTLTAPADAVVLKVGKASVGSVIDAGGAGGEPLFTLTPLGGPLEAEVRIAGRDIGFIKAGDKVRVKLDAYRFTTHGLAQGVIASISANSFTTNDDGQIVAPYYKARVAITDARLRNVPADFRLIPGLTLTGEVLVGRRTILSYIFEGALRTGSEAMREP